MPFSRRKFLSLPREHRAKKLADLLGRLLREQGRDPETANEPAAETLRNEYNELADWHAEHTAEDATEQTARPGDPRGWLALYHHWRQAAGLGPENEVIQALNTDDDHATARGPRFDYDVWLHDIRSGHNVGSILRTVDCLGLARVHRSGYTPSPEQAAVRAAAMGCETYVECLHHATEIDFFDWRETEAKRRSASGVTRPALIALETKTSTGAAPIPLAGYSWPESGILVIGNEELGIAPEILKRCDAVISIPMRGRKASMNLANAFAITAWEIGRERW